MSLELSSDMPEVMIIQYGMKVAIMRLCNPMDDIRYGQRGFS